MMHVRGAPEQLSSLVHAEVEKGGSRLMEGWGLEKGKATGARS